MRWVWAGRMMMAAAAVGVGNCAFAAHYYRPVPDYADGSTKATRRRLLDVADEVGVAAAIRSATHSRDLHSAAATLTRGT